MKSLPPGNTEQLKPMLLGMELTGKAMSEASLSWLYMAIISKISSDAVCACFCIFVPAALAIFICMGVAGRML